MNRQLSLISWIKYGFLVIVAGVMAGLSFSAWQVRVSQAVDVRLEETEQKEVVHGLSVTGYQDKRGRPAPRVSPSATTRSTASATGEL